MTGTRGCRYPTALNQPETPRCWAETARIGGGKPFRDGGGLCSPGRWPHHARSSEGRWSSSIGGILVEQQRRKGSGWLLVAKRVVPTLATNEQLRNLWKDWLEAHRTWGNRAC